MMVDCARQLGHWQEALEFDSDEQIDSEGDVDGIHNTGAGADHLSHLDEVQAQDHQEKYGGRHFCQKF